MHAKLTEGEVFLVHGGAGGIGTHAIQVGKALGATVAVTAGSAERLENCRQLGADLTINYREEDFAEVLRKETGGRTPRLPRRYVVELALQRLFDAVDRGEVEIGAGGDERSKSK